ncbi:hypothetical protein Y032_0003g1249 [Ancylostoma ceylanicum]|uniref:Uncharacterized protein n=1 Tax=Ancylostoma ceylanicum TaxID=53326 RepID=A0A016VWL0_9BILA|nr:hypothetical protein Y032_0003g1249 [Ancylostoma ceylanicum]
MFYDRLQAAAAALSNADEQLGRNRKTPAKPLEKRFRRRALNKAENDVSMWHRLVEDESSGRGVYTRVLYAI